jgi:hypothetical protein
MACCYKTKMETMVPKIMNLHNSLDSKLGMKYECLVGG